MNNKNKIIILIDILYIIIILFNPIKKLVFAINEETLKGNSIIEMTAERIGEGTPVIQIIAESFTAFILYVIFYIIKYYKISIPYFIWRFIYLKHVKEKFDKVDYKNDEYYREILKNYTVGEMSYIDEFKLSEKDIIATIMSLEYRGYIEIKDKIKILKRYDENLTEGENYILDTLNRGNEINFFVYARLVKNDCVNSGLLKKRREGIKFNKKILIYISVIVIFIVYLVKGFFNIGEGSINLILLLLILLGVAFVYIFPLLFFTSSFIKMSDPYVRTKKAKKLNKQLEGLRKYLKDYSNIDERESKEIVLWKEYLIYSVFLGINTKIVDEYKQKLKMD